jgi:predicted protein tyrosine phosphatase
MKTLTEMIMATSTPWNNPYQGKDKKVLFVCSAGILRSATGARIYADKYNTRACGCMSYALIPLSDNLIVWADEIVFVNKENYDFVKNSIDFSEKNVKVLNIPDMYEHMHPELIKAFEEQYEPIE